MDIVTSERQQIATPRTYRCLGLWQLGSRASLSAALGRVATNPEVVDLCMFSQALCQCLFIRLRIVSLICIQSRISRGIQRSKTMAAHAKIAASNKISRPVTLKHLAANLAEAHELTKRQGETLLNGLVGLITKHLKKGERVRIAGLGILQVRKRAARMGRNPATGEAIKIKASKKVAFRPSKELKLAI